MTLLELTDFCLANGISPHLVTFSYGHKEVMACFPIESIPCFSAMSFEDVMVAQEDYNTEDYPILKDLYYSTDYECFVLNIF